VPGIKEIYQNWNGTIHTMFSMKKSESSAITVIGGGLAGCEAVFQATGRQIKVLLFEMRPGVMTPAHTGGDLAELVCSNSLGSALPDRPSGLLLEELRLLGSRLVDYAEKAALPAGGALAVDRACFSDLVSQAIDSDPGISLRREEVTTIPEELTVIASGPLTSPSLAGALTRLTGEENLFFYDAIAPIVMADSINMEISFRASRFDREDSGHGDYINCPFTEEEYRRFVAALLAAERLTLRNFEGEVDQGVTAGSGHFFEGCLPVEVMATRGEDSLAFGPMRPIGLHDPRTGRRPYAVIQLRQDDLGASLYNLVGFQTNLTYSEQERVFRLIPGLEKAEFIRYGQMHRNTYLASPRLLDETLCYSERDNLLFAGQLTGVEGYLGSIASGALAGINASRLATGLEAVCPPRTTMVGALCHYISHAEMDAFQPMKANFGLLPELEQGTRWTGKREKHARLAERSLEHLEQWITDNSI
jgi:methylenetetrahydrofolate--tRNA-(uracil-5-)-methyltransferase